METPKGEKHPRLGHLPEIETFAKNEREKRLLSVWRAFRGVGSPYILPPGSPKERVNQLKGAFRKIFAYPEFAKYFKKIVAEDISPLGADELTKVATGMPRYLKTLQFLLKKIVRTRPTASAVMLAFARAGWGGSTKICGKNPKEVFDGIKSRSL